MTPAQEKAFQEAAQLLQQGFHCFPCAAPSKNPTCPHGFKDAVGEPFALRMLWRAHPGNLVGVRTGTASNLSALDLDAKHSEARSWWTTNRERLRITRVHRTRSGGLHLLFRHRDGFTCSTSKIERGVDTRGEGGYIIWWPAHGFPVLRDGPIADAPDWLIDALRPPAVVSKPAPSVPSGHIQGRSIQGLIRTVLRAREGERNAITFWAACRAGELARSGVITDDAVEALIVEAATAVGLTRSEAIRTAKNGIQAAGRY